MFDSLPLLLLILLVLGVTTYVLLGRRQAPPTKRGPTAYRKPPSWRKPLALVLMGGAIVALGLAFTQFRFLKEQEATGTVILVLDVSESMNRTDVVPSRLEAAKSAVQGFVENLPAGVQVSLVTFATEPEIVVPPTLERVRVVGSLAALAQGEGTVIGDGLTSGLDTLEEEWRRDGEGPAAVVLLSDGRDTGSEEAPDLAAARAQSLGVPVHTVVLGQFGEGEGGADEELMERIAETTGGSPYTAATADELDGVYDTIRTQISTELGVSDFGAVFVALAGVMAIGATVILLMLVRE